MKTVIAFIAVVIVIMGVYSQKNRIGELMTSTLEVRKEIVEVSPEWATDQEAVDAAQAVIRRKELETDKTRLEGQIEALESELETVDKELGYY